MQGCGPVFVWPIKLGAGVHQALNRRNLSRGIPMVGAGAAVRRVVQGAAFTVVFARVRIGSSGQ